MSNPKSPFPEVLKKMQSVMRRMPRLAGEEAVKHFRSNFDKGGFQGDGFQPWKPRRRQYKHKTLQKTGTLKRSIRVIRAGTRTIVIGSDVEYAAIHNYGGKVNAKANIRKHTRRTSKGEVSVKAHQRLMNTTIPQRQFIGNGKILSRKLYALHKAELRKEGIIKT